MFACKRRTCRSGVDPGIVKRRVLVLYNLRLQAQEFCIKRFGTKYQGGAFANPLIHGCSCCRVSDSNIIKLVPFIQHGLFSMIPPTCVCRLYILISIIRGGMKASKFWLQQKCCNIYKLCIAPPISVSYIRLLIMGSAITVI